MPAIRGLRPLCALVAPILLLALWLTASSAVASAPTWQSDKAQGEQAEGADPSCRLAGHVIPGANKASGVNRLNGIAAVSPNDVWAVGETENGVGDSQPLIERWNGAEWKLVAAPQFQGDSGLLGVDVVSAGDVWAVGYSAAGALAMRWNGVAWNIVPTPPTNQYNARLYSVTAISANDVWAVGTDVRDSRFVTLTMHWNGTQWSIVSSPNIDPPSGASPLGNKLYSASGTASNDVWAVGFWGYTIEGVPYYYGLILHWDGTRWTNAGSAGSTLASVVAISRNDAWAVNNFGSRPLIFHWNGLGWSEVPAPGPVSNGSVTLSGIAASSSSNVWAVGSYSDYSANTTGLLMMRWNGSVWSIIPTPNQDAGGYLHAVAAISPGDVRAVGLYFHRDIYQSLALARHWDGSQVRSVPVPSIQVGRNYLSDIKAIAPDNIWAVGRFSNPGQASEFGRTLVTHWDGTRWSVVPSPNSEFYPDRTSLNGVDAISASDVWAVGNFTGYYGGTFTLHWDGARWNVIPSPSRLQGNNYLHAVEAIGTNNVWAVGGAVPNGYPEYSRPIIIHWDGSQWTMESLDPLYGTDFRLNAIEAVSASDIWAVGTANAQTLIMHWDGAQWSRVTSPNVGSRNILHGLAVVSANDVWAVGYYGPAGTGQALTLHWNGTEWSVVPSANPGTGASYLFALDAVSPEIVWTAGDYDINTEHNTLVERFGSIAFTDVPASNTFYPYVQCLACRGIESGYACGGQGEPCDGNNNPYFRPNTPITRDQIAKMVAASAGFNEPAGSQRFQDVPPTSPYYDYINRMAARGLIGGYPCGATPSEPCVAPNDRPYFRPSANATRGQIAKIVSNGAGFNEPRSTHTFQDVPPGQTFYIWIERLTYRGVMGGYPCGTLPHEPCVAPDYKPYFRWGNNATRGQTAKITSNTFFPNCGPFPGK